MPEDDAIRLAYTMDFYGSQPTPLTPKVGVPESPIHTSQKDIKDVITTIVGTPTPILGGYGQLELTS